MGRTRQLADEQVGLMTWSTTSAASQRSRDQLPEIVMPDLRTAAAEEVSMRTRVADLRRQLQRERNATQGAEPQAPPYA